MFRGTHPLFGLTSVERHTIWLVAGLSTASDASSWRVQPGPFQPPAATLNVQAPATGTPGTTCWMRLFVTTWS
jgi:hypothetical protein